MTRAKPPKFSNDAPHRRAPEDVPEPLLPPPACGAGGVLHLPAVRELSEVFLGACECMEPFPDRTTRAEAEADLDQHRSRPR